MNSARVHYSWLTWSNSAVGTKKKKKKSENAAQDLAENAESKRTHKVIELNGNFYI